MLKFTKNTFFIKESKIMNSLAILNEKNVKWNKKMSSWQCDKLSCGKKYYDMLSCNKMDVVSCRNTNKKRK